MVSQVFPVLFEDMEVCYLALVLREISNGLPPMLKKSLLNLIIAIFHLDIEIFNRMIKGGFKK